MYARREMNQHMLLRLDDEHDENKKLKEFYETNLPFLMTHPVADVPYLVKRTIALMLDRTKLFDYDWQDYATKMGITDTFKLTEIQVAADRQGEQPLFLAMHKVLVHNGYFGQIIRALLSTQRYDILGALESYVRGLLKSSSKTEVKRIISVEEQTLVLLGTEKNPTSSSQSPKELNIKPVLCSVSSLSDNNSENNCVVKSNSAIVDEHKKCEFDTFQQRSINSYSTNAFQIHNSPVSNESSSEGSLEEIKQMPSAPAEDRLSVFIQHTEYDSDIAKQLSVKLREEGMIVTTLSDMDDLIPMDAIGALTTMFHEVDFIVPIVSGTFLQQIYPKNYEKYLESTYAMNNRNLYQLIMNEYRNNRCVNFRVRPVIVPEMNKRLLKDVVLSVSFRLWSEVPKLIRILKKNKESRPQDLVN